MNTKSTPVTYLDGLQLNSFLASQGLDQVSRRPFWYNSDSGQVQPLREVDESVLVQQKLLEASFSSNIPSYPLDSPFNNVNHYRSVVYLAIQAQMNALSAGRLVMEVPRPGGTLQGDHGDGDDGYVPFTDHQLFDYLQEPSPTQSFSAFLGEILLQWYLTGRVLVWGVPNDWGLPVRFYVLPTALCQPAFNLNNQLYPEGAWLVQQYYPYTGMIGLLPGPLGTPGAIIDAREIYQMKNPHPLYKWAPFSPMTGVSVGIDVLEMIDRSCWSVYRNGVKPTGILTIPGGRQDQVEDVEAKLNQKHVGPDNHGKTFVTGGRPDAGAPQYTPLNATPDSMAYDTRTVYESLILAGVTGSDRAVVGLREGGSYSERWAAIQDVQIRTYEPMLRRVCDMLNMGPVRAWNLSNKRVRVRIKLPKIDDPLLNEQRINARSADGSFTTDEVRAQSGMPPDPLGLGHLPTGVRQQVILMLAEQGQLPANPNPPTPAMEVVDVPDPSDDGTALGALRSGIEMPEGEPVGPEGSGLQMRPRQPRNAGMRGKGVPTPKPRKVEETKPGGGKKPKRKAKGKGRQAKALPENPEHRTEAVVAIHNHLLEHPLDHLARSIYADELEEAGAIYEAAVHRAIATAHLPLDDPNNHWDTVRNSATHETGVAASHIAREMTEHGRRGTNNDRVGYGSNARIALENAHTGARHDSILAHAAAQRVHAAEARYYNDDTPDDRDMRAKHTAAESAHLVAEAIHRSLQYRNVQTKAQDSGTDSLGGSMVGPPAQTPLPRRRKQRRRRAVSALVAEVLGEEPELLEDRLEVRAWPDGGHYQSRTPQVPQHDLTPLSVSVTDGTHEVTGFHKSPGKFEQFSRSNDLGLHVGSEQQAHGRDVQSTGPHRTHYVYHLTARIRNPARLHDGDWDTPVAMSEALDRLGVTHPASVAVHEAAACVKSGEGWKVNKAATLRAFKRALMGHGHEGAVYSNQEEGPGDSYIAFNPHQVTIHERRRLLSDPFSGETTSFSYAEPERPGRHKTPLPGLEVKADVPSFNRVRVTRHHLATLPIVHAIALHPEEPREGMTAGANMSSLVTLDHPRRQIRGIFKPQIGEHPQQLKISVPHGGQTDRESLASHVAEIVGVHDLVPPTSLRNEGGIRGSIQRFVPGARPAYGESDNAMRFGPSHHDVMRAGAFDYLIGNTDRHAGNWLLRPHKAQGEKLTLIDHGLSFPVMHTHEYAESAYLHKEAARLQEAHGYETPDITSGGDRGKWSQILKAMVHHGLSTDAINETRRRWNLLANGRHTLTQLHQNSTHALTEKL